MAAIVTTGYGGYPMDLHLFALIGAERFQQ